MSKIVNQFVKDESGATAIEDGLIAAGISVAIITDVNTLGSRLKSTFTKSPRSSPPPTSEKLSSAGARTRYTGTR